MFWQHVTNKTLLSTCLEPDEGPWIKFLIQDSYDYYFNEESREGTCIPPEGITPKTSWLTGEEIQVRYCRNKLLGIRSGGGVGEYRSDQRMKCSTNRMMYYCITCLQFPLDLK